MAHYHAMARTRWRDGVNVQAPVDSVNYSTSQSAVTIRDVFRIVWRRIWIILIIVAAAVGTATYISFNTPERWRAQSQIILVQKTPPVYNVGQQQGGSGNLQESAATQVAMLRSYAMAIRTLTYLRNQELEGNITADMYRGLDPEKLLKNMDVAAAEGTNMISIQAEAKSREQARVLADATAEAFVEWKREVASQGALETVYTLEDRVQKAKAQLESAEQREIAFKKNNRMVDVGTEAGARVENYLKRDQEYIQAQQAVEVQEARVAALERELQQANQAIATGTGVRDDSLATSLQQQLTALEIQKAAAATRYRENYPGAGNPAEIDRQIADIKGRLDKALKGTLDNKRPSLASQAAVQDQYNQARLDLAFSRAQLGAASAALSDARGKTAGLPETHLEYAHLAREVELAKGLYTNLQASLNAARLDKDSSTGNVQIAQKAFVPSKPFAPNHLRDILFGLAVGLALAFFALLVLEQGDSKVRSLDDARELVAGPVVGALPRWSTNEMRELKAGNTSLPAHEAYSLARVNLAHALRQGLNGHGEGPQTILITSAVPGEGKSFTAAQMARSLARAGKRVVLVDSDMRRPAQNTLFGTEEPVGLADVLSGKIGLDQALVSSDTTNLILLHSGSPDMNPTDLLSVSDVQALLDDLKQGSDYVIIDSPACSVVADSLLLAPHVDCILHVIGAGHADAAIVRDTTDALSNAGPRMMLFFVNRVPRESSGGYSHYYYYGSSRTNRQTDLVETAAASGAAGEEGDENA